MCISIFCVVTVCVWFWWGISCMHACMHVCVCMPVCRWMGVTLLWSVFIYWLLLLHSSRRKYYHSLSAYVCMHLRAYTIICYTVWCYIPSVYSIGEYKYVYILQNNWREKLKKKNKKKKKTQPVQKRKRVITIKTNKNTTVGQVLLMNTPQNTTKLDFLPFWSIFVHSPNCLHGSEWKHFFFFVIFHCIYAWSARISSCKDQKIP